jgi:hypothetical protein
MGWTAIFTLDTAVLIIISSFLMKNLQKAAIDEWHWCEGYASRIDA